MKKAAGAVRLRLARLHEVLQKLTHGKKRIPAFSAGMAVYDNFNQLMVVGRG